MIGGPYKARQRTRSRGQARGNGKPPTQRSVRGKKGPPLPPSRGVGAAEASQRAPDELPHGVTMWNPRTSTEDELIVIKHIMVRESLVQRMREATRLVNERRTVDAAELVRMLRQVRAATLEAVHHIEVWRRRFVRVVLRCVALCCAVLRCTALCSTFISLLFSRVLCCMVLRCMAVVPACVDGNGRGMTHHSCVCACVAQITKRPFEWEGDNYLLRLPCSLDFLQRVPGVCDRLGFGLIRNPFVVPAPPKCITLPDGRVLQPKLRHTGGLSMLKVREMEALVVEEEARLGRWPLYKDVCSWCGLKCPGRMERVVCGTCRRKYCSVCLVTNYSEKEKERLLNMKDSWTCFSCQDVLAEQQLREEAAREVRSHLYGHIARRALQCCLVLGAWWLLLGSSC